MEIFKMKECNGYAIYDCNADYNYGSYAICKKDDDKAPVWKINLDVDKRGGLKIIYIEETTRKKIKDLEPIMYVKNKDFIPVTGWFGMSCDDGQLIVQEQYQKIFENRYLKYKCKYILWNDVVEKVRFFGAVPHPTIDHDYDGYDQVYTIVQE